MSICSKISLQFPLEISLIYQTHSLFDSVINLIPIQPAYQSPNMLLTLARHSNPSSKQLRTIVPFGAELRSGQQSDLFFESLQDSSTLLSWNSTSSVLTLFRPHDASFSRQFSWRDDSTQSWDAVLRAPPCSPSRSLTPAAARLLTDIKRGELGDPLRHWTSSLTDQIQGDLVRNAFLEKAQQVNRVLAAQHVEKAEMQRILRGMLGLGHGLTPSGDDFVIGLCAAMLWMRHPLAEDLKELCQQGAKSDRITTMVSRSFLTAAAQCYFSAFIHRLLIMLLPPPHLEKHNDDVATYDEILEYCRSFGASSGFDTLYGILMILNPFFFQDRI